MRPLKASDWRHSIRWRNDPQVREGVLGYRLPVTEVMEKQWFKTALNDQGKTRVVFAIEDAADGKMAGFVYLHRIDWVSRTAYFTILIGERDRQGKGMAREAMHLLYRYAFGVLNLRKICLEVAEYNRRARALYEEFGFQVEGRLQKQVYLADRYFDVILMALFREDYSRKYGSSPSGTGREPR